MEYVIIAVILLVAELVYFRIAHGADALAAARCTWGAEGSLGQRPNVPGAMRGGVYRLI